MASSGEAPVELLVKTAIVACVAASLTLTACGSNHEHEPPPPTAESIGADASITAIALVRAKRACAVVGVESLEDCTKLKGTLLAEQGAQLNASMARDWEREYWQKCSKGFSKDYCEDLLKRALAIEEKLTTSVR
jgi:hypothetical protein